MMEGPVHTNPLSGLMSAAYLLREDGHPAHAEFVRAYVESMIGKTHLPDDREDKIVMDEVGVPHPFDAEFCGPKCRPVESGD
jgi:hypothetical protein